MANKKTKKEYFGELRELVGDRSDLIEFIDHELELLDKKASNKGQTATQKENEVLKDLIVEFLNSNPNMIYTVSELQKNITEFEGLSNQKVSALCKQLFDNKIIDKMVDKKKSYFKALAE